MGLFSKNNRLARKEVMSNLKIAAEKYDVQYGLLKKEGEALYESRARSLSLLNEVEELVNSIANTPQHITTKLEKVTLSKDEFIQNRNYGKEAMKRLGILGAGALGGAAIGGGAAAMMPSAAIWAATTFGKTAAEVSISALSGAAQMNAALAWLGGGAVAAGGSGIAGGSAFLALAEPIGWGVGATTLLASALLFWKSSIKDKEKKVEQTIRLNERRRECEILTEKVKYLKYKNNRLIELVQVNYDRCQKYRGKELRLYMLIAAIRLMHLVNSAKALAANMSKTIE